MPPQTRINSIDLLRGIVMVIMALDHTRDFFHREAFTGNPLNLETTTPFLFFTRWITHLCAPTFVFLSGTSAYLQGLRKSKKKLSWFLFTRGLWLILFEVVVMTLGITFDLGYNTFILQTIWAIGISMVILSGVIWLPFPLVLTIGLVIVLGHNSLDYYEVGKSGPFPFWYGLLHVQSFYKVGDTNLFIFYPFLAWTGLMILGYCFGKYYMNDVINRNKRSIILGAGILLFFVVLRWTNSYGDPFEWSVQPTALYTFFSFINTQKYPPSLLFMCVTIGVSLLILGLIGNVRNKFADVITVFGRVPLFYYALHFYVLHAAAMIFSLLRGHTFSEGVKGTPNVPLKFVFPNEGLGLGGTYLVWIFVVLALYPICKWYSNYKFNNRRWWLSYL
ncbi:MAG: DUF1624 domain-containing protein [Chitinophagaceae bacterium]|nr:DUF1624 domain-containing protein [Chitinophagaceae bacterium]